MNITYHIVPEQYYRQFISKKIYTPMNFEKERFIHCTDGEFALSVIANNIYKDLKDNLLVLFINKNRILEKIKYEDSTKLFPHIYSELNKNLILKVEKMEKDSKNNWIFPIQKMKNASKTLIK